MESVYLLIKKIVKYMCIEVRPSIPYDGYLRQPLLAFFNQYRSSHALPKATPSYHTHSLTASISPLCRQLLIAAIYQNGTTTHSSSHATTVLLSHWEKGVPCSRTEFRRALLEGGREGRERERERENMNQKTIKDTTILTFKPLNSSISIHY